MDVETVEAVREEKETKSASPGETGIKMKATSYFVSCQTNQHCDNDKTLNICKDAVNVIITSSQFDLPILNYNYLAKTHM